MSGAARDTNGGLHVVNVSAGYGFKPMHVSLGLAREVIFDLICGWNVTIQHTSWHESWHVIQLLKKLGHQMKCV